MEECHANEYSDELLQKELQLSIINYKMVKKQSSEERRDPYEHVLGNNLKFLRKIKWEHDQLLELDSKMKNYTQVNAFVKRLKEKNREQEAIEQIKKINGMHKALTSAQLNPKNKSKARMSETEIAKIIYREINMYRTSNDRMRQYLNLSPSDEKQNNIIVDISEEQYVEVIKLTPFLTPDKMIKRLSIDPSLEETVTDGEVEIKTVEGSVQIQGDIVKDSGKIFSRAVEASKKLGGTGKYSAILMDPPWNNTGCQLGYDTLDNESWMDLIDFDMLQDNGLVFLWVSNKMDVEGIKYMTKWFYEKFETVTWVKAQKNGDLLRRGGYTLWHASELCLVFRKLEKGELVRDHMLARQTENVIISRPEGLVSTKPLQIYDLIETLMPNGIYLEIFGRAHNARKGWVTIGNESIRYKNSSLNQNNLQDGPTIIVKKDKLDAQSKVIKKSKPETKADNK